jgi:hypothetical protein
MSKRWILGMMLVGSILGQPAIAQETPSAAPQAAAPAATVQAVDLAIVVGGQTLDKEQPPIMVDGRVLIPLRKVFNALGATVKYENKIIDAQRGKQTVQLSPGSNAAKINGQDTLLDVPPMLVDTVTYVPLRFVATALGDSVVYDPAAKTITVAPAGPAGMPAGAGLPPDRLEVLKGSLKRLAVGNQGAILKVWNQDSTDVAYYRGLDDRNTAPYDDEDQTSMLSTLGYTQSVADTAKEIMDGFMQLPRREAVAYLGLIHSIEDDSPLEPPDEVDVAIKQFLIQVMKSDKDVVVRRQACLALAVGDILDQEVLNAILDFYSGSENLWETFPVQQFFQFQAEKIREMPNLAETRQRVAAVNSLYTPAALRYLDGEEDD